MKCAAKAIQNSCVCTEEWDEPWRGPCCRTICAHKLSKTFIAFICNVCQRVQMKKKKRGLPLDEECMYCYHDDDAMLHRLVLTSLRPVTLRNPTYCNTTTYVKTVTFHQKGWYDAMFQDTSTEDPVCCMLGINIWSIPLHIFITLLPKF